MKQSVMDVLSIAGLFLMVAGLVLLYLNGGLFSYSPWVIAFQVIAVLLMIWARITFGGRSFHASANPTEGGLVTTGPYRYVRHPIYAAVLLFTWAGIFGNPTIVNALLGLLLFGGAFTRILCEERLVRVRYPEYDQYAERTKRLIPYVF